MKAMTMEDLVGARVLIHLHPELFQALDVQGIEERQFVARVLGIDGFGVWVENPRYCTTPTYSDEGDYIEIADRKEICHRAAVLLQWSYIQTILHFPDRLTFGATLGESEIGFHVPVGGGRAVTPAAAKTGRARAARPAAKSSGKAVKRG
jgi:hypothetical protein